MTIEYQLQQFPFRNGIEQGQDPKQVPPGTMKSLVNMVWNKSGRIEKRLGVKKYGSATIPGCKRLGVRDRELLAVDGASLFGVGSSIVSKGPVATEEVYTSPVIGSVKGVAFADQVTLSNGNSVIVWIEGDNYQQGVIVESPGLAIYYKIVDSSGSEVIGSTLASSSNVLIYSLRIVTDGTNWCIFYIHASLNVPDRMSAYPSSTLTSSVVATNVTQPGIDAVYATSGAIVAFGTASGVRLIRFDLVSASISTAATVDASSSTARTVALAVVGSFGMLGVYQAPLAIDIRVMTFDLTSLAVTNGPTSISSEASDVGTRSASMAILATSSSDAIVGWSENYGSFSNGYAAMGQMTFRRISSSAGTVGGRCFSTQLRILSKPWIDFDGSVQCLVSTNGGAIGLGATTVGDRLDETMIVKVVIPSSAVLTSSPLITSKIDTLVGTYWKSYCVTQVVSGASSANFLCPFISDFGPVTSLNGAKRVYVSAPSSDPWMSIQLGKETVFLGSVVHAYDGSFSLPYGFSYPANINRAFSVSSTSGGSVPAGSYSFVSSPERRSAAGVLHRGPPSLADAIVTTGTTSTITLKIAPIWDSPQALGLTASDELIKIFFITPGSSTLVWAPNFSAINGKPSVAAPEKVITITGNLLAGTVPIALYTESGELEDVQPPGMVTGCIYRNRIYAVDNTGLAVWFTKRVDQNPDVAPGWNSTNRLIMDQRVTALAVLDDRLVIFTAKGIFIYASDGPELNGEYQGGRVQPNKLQTDVGCTNARSVVSVSDGVYFQCGDQIQLLTRKLTVDWIGKPVQDILGPTPVITSAVLVEQQNHVRFTTMTGATLVHDYVEGQWSQFNYLGGTPIVDAIMHAGAYTFVTSSGQVYKETQGYWLDDGTYVSGQFETAEISAAGPIAYHNIRKVQFDGLSQGDHVLTVETAFNGETTWTQTLTVASGVNNVTAPGPIEELKVDMGRRRKCRTVRYRVTDTAPTEPGSGQGPAWSAMGIEFGVNKGFGRLPARNRA